MPEKKTITVRAHGIYWFCGECAHSMVPDCFFPNKTMMCSHFGCKNHNVEVEIPVFELKVVGREVRHDG